MNKINIRFICLEKHARIQRGTGGMALENHKAEGFLSNTGPDPLEKYKATKQARFNVGPSSACQADDGW